MPATNYGTAQAQSVLMLQRVNKVIEKSQNLDCLLQKQFTTITGDTIGLQAYRQEMQTEIGGLTGAGNGLQVLASNTLSSSTTNTVTNKIKITYNGTVYYLLASTSGT